MALALSKSHDEEAEVKDFIALMKPGVMILVLWSGLTALVLAPTPLAPALMIASLFFMAMGSGGAAALNMWYERKLDGLMTRTANRPLPARRMAAGEAMGFGAVLSVASIIFMGVFISWLAAGLLALTIGFYVFVYTIWLKPMTAQNIVIGGAAGAMPPLIGWASATGTLDWMALWLFLIIFLWTPPHFWPLALMRKREYEKAALPMMPSIAGDQSTCLQILIYSVILFFASFLPMISGAGWLYGLVALGLGVEFLRRGFFLWRQSRLSVKDKILHSSARKLFLFSMIYLFGLLTALMIDYGLAPYV